MRARDLRAEHSVARPRARDYPTFALEPADQPAPPPAGRSPLPPWAWPAIAAAFTVAAIAAHGLWRVAAVAGVLVLAPGTTAALKQALGPARWTAIVRAAPIALLVGVAGWMLWPLATGEPPASRDHAIHYFQARILVDEMLPTGRLSGWTERFNHGFPFGEGYPTLGVLWASAAHLLSFGALDLRESYAWGILAVWSLTLWGVWRIAATIATDVRARHEPDARVDDVVSRWAGCAGAFAWLLDPGAARQGGWNYLMFHGVWPQQLSCALWVAALVWMLRALQNHRPRTIAIAAICLAASLLAHPFGLLTTAASAVGLAVVVSTAEDAKAWPAGGLRILALVHVLAIALAAAGLATFLAAAGELGRSPVAWSELGELAAQMTTGELLAGAWAWSGALAVVGLGLALWSGRAGAWLAAGLCCGLLLLGSREAITMLRLDLIASGFKNLQFPRFAIAVKPIAFALAGVALVMATRAIARAVQGARPMLGRTRRWFVALVLAPGIATLLGRTDLFAPRPVANIETLRRSDLAIDERALGAALVAEQDGLRTQRVAFLRAEMGGGTYPMFAIADAGAAAVLDGHVATVNFEHTIERRSVPVFQRLGVTHVLHDRPLGEADADLAAALEPIGEFGPYTLARFVAPAQEGPRFVRGEGRAIEVEHTPVRRVYQVLTDGGTLELPQAPSSRWQWTLDGEPLESTSSSVHGDMHLAAAIVPHSGEVLLAYVTTTKERWGRWISLAAAIATALLLLRGRPLTLRPWFAAPRRARLVPAVLAATGVIFAIVLLRRQHAQLDRTWHAYVDERFFAKRDAPPDFVDDLTLTREITVVRAARPACDGILGKDALVDCEEGDFRPNPSFVYVEPYLYRCLSFGVAAGDTATVRLGAPGDRIVGFALRRGSEGKGRHLRFATHKTLQILGNRRADLLFEPTNHPDGAVLTVENAGEDPEIICVGAARFD